MKSLGPVAVVVASLGLVSIAKADTLSAGDGKTYPTPCAAVAVAKTGDVIEVAMGTYTDSCSMNVAGVTVKGVGGRPKIDVSGTDHPAEYKGVFVVNADNVRIENLELMGAHISDDNGANGAGIRDLASGLVVHGCYIHDNQNGILGAPPNAAVAATATVTVENTEFAGNGLGNGCNLGGCTHNVYLGNFASAVFQYNWTHDIAGDGHLFKSRAKVSSVLYNRVTGQDGHDSYALDFPAGGVAIVVGNVIEKGTNPGNTILIEYGEEQLLYTDNRLFVASNTFVNDANRGTFINVKAGSLTAHNNLFVGGGTISSTGTLPADNLTGADPLFVARAQYDYHLMAGSPAIDKGVDPGTADAFSLVPVAEYVQPTSAAKRKSDGKLDVGAFEYGTDPSIGLDADGGTGGGDTGTPSSGSGTSSTSADGGATGATSGAATSSGNAGCNAGGNPLGAGGLVGGAVLALGLLRRRRRPRA